MKSFNGNKYKTIKCFRICIFSFCDITRIQLKLFCDILLDFKDY